MREKKTIRIAILDLYEGVANQGMRCIREILHQYREISYKNIVSAEFDVRLRNEVPDLSYDIYISSGGPGSPLETEQEWEKHYFNWLQQVVHWNNKASSQAKKHVFFICHSFQLACRFFNIAQVTKRRSTAFGVFPVHMLLDGKDEPVFEGLKDPFYAVDSRDFQVVQPNHGHLLQMGGKILCIEKERPHVALERAVMAARFNEYMIGTQFHPEADSEGMTMYLQREDKKKTVIENHGQEKWQSMIDHLNDPDKILWTHSHILPNFLSQAILHFEEAVA